MMRCGHVRQAIVGEKVCGDHHVVVEGPDFIIAAVVDGLGHGPEALEPANLAVAYIQAHPDRHPCRLLEDCHLSLRGTRGAALAVVRIDLVAGTLIHAGLGNVETHLIGADRVRHPVSMGGIVGANVRKLRSEEFPFVPGDMLVMHSDGVSDRMRLDPAMRLREPQGLAYELVLAYGRTHDDQLLLTLRCDP